MHKIRSSSPATQSLTELPQVPRQERRYAHRLAAFRALREGLKYAYDNWRMWANYTLIALEVGELHECVRALGRVVEERAEKDGAACVDEDVLDRLVDAAARTSAVVSSASKPTDHTLSAIPEDADGAAPAIAASAPTGLTADAEEVAVRTSGSLQGRVTDLFERTLLPRVSSTRIFRAYARLKTAQGAWTDALKAHLDAYRASPHAAGPWTTPAAWLEALREVEEAVDVLRELGPRAGTNWELQARGLVRTFAARSRDFRDEPEWARVETLQEDLKKRDE